MRSLDQRTPPARNTDSPQSPPASIVKSWHLNLPINTAHLRSTSIVVVIIIIIFGAPGQLLRISDRMSAAGRVKTKALHFSQLHGRNQPVWTTNDEFLSRKKDIREGRSFSHSQPIIGIENNKHNDHKWPLDGAISHQNLLVLLASLYLFDLLQTRRRFLIVQ